MIQHSLYLTVQLYQWFCFIKLITAKIMALIELTSLGQLAYCPRAQTPVRKEEEGD